MANKTLFGKVLKYIGTDPDGEAIGPVIHKGPPTPSAFQAKWLTVDELVLILDKAERDEPASMREENWRANLLSSGFSGIRKLNEGA